VRLALAQEPPRLPKDLAEWLRLDWESTLDWIREPWTA
jgi:hypothetical protein